jgi:hypothetical protein
MTSGQGLRHVSKRNSHRTEPVRQTNAGSPAPHTIRPHGSAAFYLLAGQMATADTRENGQMALFVPMDPLVTVSSWEAAGPHAISKEPFA